MKTNIVLLNPKKKETHHQQKLNRIRNRQDTKKTTQLATKKINLNIPKAVLQNKKLWEQINIQIV